MHSTETQPSFACDLCYKRKIKCDRTWPQCDWCRHRNVQCTYGNSPSRPRRGRRSRYMESMARLDAKRREMPMAASRAPVASPGVSSNVPLPNATPSIAFLHFAGWKIGAMSPEGGIPSLHPEGVGWIQSRTGQPVSFPVSKPPWGKRSKPRTPDVISNLSLPSRPTLQRYLDVFHMSTIHNVLPIISAPLFAETIELAYGSPQAATSRDAERQCARACVFAFMALIATMDYHGTHCTAPSPPLIARAAYISQARVLVAPLIHDLVTIDALQTALALALLGIMGGELQHATHYLGISCRLITTLGGHMVQPMCTTSPDNPTDLETTKHLRNLFWLCYALDKDVSLRTSQPHYLKDEDCMLQLPAGYHAELLASVTTLPATHDGESFLFPIDLRLSMLKSRIFTTLYSLQGISKSDADLIRSIRELDEELEAWRVSLPPDVRPTLSFAGNVRADRKNKNMFLVLLHLNYYLCINIIHRAGSRCAAWHHDTASTTIEPMMQGLQSSLAMSVDASRSLLLFLQASESMLSIGTFWTVLFYPMSAMLTLFCHILQNPSERSRPEVRLLTATGHATERIFSRQISQADTQAHLESVMEFTSALETAAYQAIDNSAPRG